LHRLIISLLLDLLAIAERQIRKIRVIILRNNSNNSWAKTNRGLLESPRVAN